MSETRITELDPWRQITVDKDYITERGPEGDRTRIHLSQPETRRRVAAALLEGLEPENPAEHPEHEPVQHRDGKPPWCNACGLTAGYQVPQSSFASKKGYGTHVPEQAAVAQVAQEEDPIVLAIRESDLASTPVRRRPLGGKHGSPGTWEALNGTWLYSRDVTTRQLDEDIETDRLGIIRALSVKRAFAAEKAVDQIEEKAVETFKAAWHKADDEGDSGNRVRRGIQALKDAGLLVGRRGHE